MGMSLCFICLPVCILFLCRADVILEFMLFQFGDYFCWDGRSGVILCMASILLHTFMFAGQFYWQIAFWLACFDGKHGLDDCGFERAFCKWLFELWFFRGCCVDCKTIQFHWKQSHCQVRRLGSCAFYSRTQLLNGAGSGFFCMASWHGQCSGKLLLPIIPRCSKSFACPFLEKGLTVCCG